MPAWTPPPAPRGCMSSLEHTIDLAWEKRAALTRTRIDKQLRPAIEDALALLESGKRRVAEPVGKEWRVNLWLKKAVLLYFRINESRVIGGDPMPAWDKDPLRFDGFDEIGFSTLGARIVPGAVVRRGAHIGKEVVLMPSFVNIGAYVGSGTMVG